MDITAKRLASMIDQTLLKPETTKAQVEAFCREALGYGFAAVCVEPVHNITASAILRGSVTRAAAVCGFPLGAVTTEIKVAETRLAMREGMGEIDMVMDIGALIAGDREKVRSDIQSVVDAAKDSNPLCITKVIFENCLLTDDQKKLACEIALETDVDFIKTSTGFNKSGATAHDVALMHSMVGAVKGVKAAGGIRTLDDALAMIEAGATRIGTSAGVAIVKQAAERFGA